MKGDAMYLHQVLWQPDGMQFMEAVIKEVNSHIDNDHWKLIPCKAVSEDTEVVLSVWATRRKHNLTTGAVTKHKARLNLHSGKQDFGRSHSTTTQMHWLSCGLPSNSSLSGILFH